MPTPDISLLDADHLRDYQWAIQNFPNKDPSEIYAPLYADQQATIEAQQALQKQGEINDALKDGRMEDVPQEVQDVFQPPDGSRLSSPFKAMVPGFDPVIPPVERQLPATSIQAIRDGRSLYDPQNRNKAELEATQTAAQYYLNQGYPSFETAQNSSISNFLAKYGDKEDFTNNNPLGLALTPKELQARWDTMYAVAKDPPSGFLQTAEQKGFEDIQGQMDRSVPGSLWNPSQPRRYAEWGDMAKVGPRGEGITELGQGASGVAEDFRRQPDLVREMGTGRLFSEAVRPQVIKSGEQVRRERDKAQQIRSRVLESVAELMKPMSSSGDTGGYTEKEAFEKITKEYLEQAKITIRKEMIPRITPMMSADFRSTNPSMLTASVDEVHTRMVNDEAKAQVLNFYREAELYDYALEHTDLLKGPGTYYTRAGSALYDAYKYVAEDEQGDEFTQMRKKSGRIDKDAITEGTTTQYARNLNLPFRMIYNPLFDIAGETADLLDGEEDEKAMRTGMSEVKFADKYSQTISSPTLDLTDETSWKSPLTVLDAYFKEVLLETAVGRTAGNDIVSFMPTEYYDYMQENANNPNEIPFWGDPDTFVIAGTLAEVMIPIEWFPGMLAKAISTGSRMPANWKTYAKVAQEIQKAGGVADPTQYGRFSTTFMENSSVAAHAADDAADVILGLERVADGVVDAKLATQGLSQRAKTITEIAIQVDEPAIVATKRIAEIAGDEKTYPLLSIAAKDSQARQATRSKSGKSRAEKRTDLIKKPHQDPRPKDTLDVVAETLAHQSMKGKVAARLEGEVGLGDYHLLTDRMAVSKQFLDEHPINELVGKVHEQLGPLKPKEFGVRQIEPTYFKYDGKPVREGMWVEGSDRDMHPINYGRLFQKDRAHDPFLDEIIAAVKEQKEITYAQDVYLRQRVLEKVAMIEDRGKGLFNGFGPQRTGSAAIMPIEEGTDFAKMTQVPSERRLETARAIRSTTPRAVRDALHKTKEWVVSGMKKSDLQNLGKADDPRIVALQKLANESQVSLQRQIPLVAAKLRKKDGFTDEAVVDIMFDTALRGQDPTELLTAQNIVAKTAIDADPAQVQAFYSQLLGPSLDLPANRLAFQQSGALTNGLDNVGINMTLREMQDAIPGALDTAAVSARQRKGAVAVADVDITGAKIAYATDKARKIRLDKVFQESGLGSDLVIDLGEQAQKMNAPGKETQIAAALDEIAASQVFGKPLENADYERLYKSIYDKDFKKVNQWTAKNFFTKKGIFVDRATQMANYIKGKRVAGETAGYRADMIEELFPQQLKLMVQGDKGIMQTPEGQKQIAAIFADIEGAKKGVAQNMTRLRRPIDRGALATASDLWDYTFNIKGRLVSGQLGGMASPNTIYHTQNIITAPLIASITAPEYVGAIVDQQLRMVAKMATGKSPSVADDVMRSGGGEPVMGYFGLNRFVSQTMDDGSQYIGKYSVEEAIDLYRTKNLGSTQEAMWLDDAFVNEVRKQAQGRGIPQRMIDDMIRDIPGSKVITGTTATERKGQQSVGMLLADSTDRAFREAVFFEALKRGRTGDEAAQLAREVLLDFGAMPGIAQETLGKAFLYMSFTYMMGQNTLLALADPKKYRVLVSQLNYHRKLSEDLAGSGQTEMSDKVLKWRMDTSANGDAYAVFINNPVVGSFAQVAEITEAMRASSFTTNRLKELAQEPQVMEAGLSGLLDIGYNPFLDMLKTVQMEYKKPLPNKVVYQISALERTGILAGADAKDFFDLEYVPIEKRRLGKAEVGVDRYTIDPQTLERKKMTIDEVEEAELGGYQLRFKTERGYQKFVAMQQILQFAGYGRLLNDTTGAAIAAGYLPEGTTFGYDEKSMPIFQLAGGKIMRVPKDWEKYDRQVRQYERDLMEFLKTYE